MTNFTLSVPPTPDSMSSWRIGRITAYACCLLCLLLSATALAERVPTVVPGGRPVDVPKALTPWVPWVIDGLGDELCAKLDDKPLCQWPTQLKLDVAVGGARFALDVVLDAEGWLRLPGSGEYWPLEVTIDSKDAVVLARDAEPVTRLSRGRHVIVGHFRWAKAPETLAVPAAIALIALNVDNREIAFPRREDTGAVWLQATTGNSEPAAERVDIEVMRRIDDGVPLRVTSQIVLHASGRSRELRLARPLPEGGRVISMSSPVPSRFEPNGDLILQIHAGEHHIELVSVHPTPPESLTLPEHGAPWPSQEVWVFQPATALRQVMPKGAPTIDPAQTNLPEEWKKLQAFSLSPGHALQFETTRRGQPDPPPNQVTVNRHLWLDLDGGGYTVRDQLTGNMNQNWRLELLAAPVGRARVENADSLVTQSGNGTSGIELRSGSLNVTAEWRFERSLTDLPAVGWNTDVKSLTAALSLPPGWEALYVSGVDSASDTWVSQWTLWGFFFVLVVAIAVGRLLGPKWGVLALATLVLAHERDGAPVVSWVVLLVLMALLAWVPAGKFRWVVRVAWFGAAVVFAAIATQFIVEEVRHALFPSTSTANHGFAPTFALEDLKSTGAADSKLDVAPAAEPQPESESESGAGMRAKGGSLSASVKTAKRGLDRYASEPTVDPDSVIQTGPGLPSWTWGALQLKYNGPVQRDQRMRVWLLAPWATGILACLRAALVAWLGYMLIRSTAYRAEPPARTARRRSARPLAAVAAGMVTLLFSHVASAQIDSAMLGELKNRLMRGPDCDSCLEVAELRFSIQNGSLHAEADVHAGAVTSYQVPGPARNFAPAKVEIDGKPAAVILYTDGFLHVRVEPGRHRISVAGPIAGNDLTLTAGSKPHHVEVAARGWNVDGVRDGQIEGSLHFSADAGSNPDVSNQPALHISLPPWLQITRTFEIGVTFRVKTQVTRVSPKGDPISLRFPILPGEEITEQGALVDNGQLVLTLDRDQTEMNYRSVLSTRPSLVLVANFDRPWSEEWRFVCSTIWHCDFSGIAPYQQLDNGSYAPRFAPWPKEQLAVQLSKAKAAKGESRTIDRVNLEVTPGQRLLAADMRWTERVSKGDTEIVELPGDAVVQTLSVNDADEPIRLNHGRLELGLHPGTQNVHLTFYRPGGLRTWFTTPAVKIGGKAVNANLKVLLPSERWLLFTAGPSWGPKVLLWSYLLLLVGAAYVLSRLPKSPLRLRQWWLLGLGLTQVPLPVALVIASWFFVLVLRGAWEPERRAFGIVWRLFVAAWTLVFLGCLTGTVYDGLVSNPDMHVTGSMSGLGLEWYVDRIKDALPTASVISVPVSIWRLLNLLWALWLAASLVGWLRWGFAEYARKGLWPARKIAMAAAASGGPNVCVPDQPEPPPANPKQD